MQSWDLKTIYNIARETVNEFIEDRAPRLGAALAYYTVFSLAPLLIIVITVAGLVFDPDTVRMQLVTQFQGLIGPEGAEMVTTMLETTREEHQRGILATGLGVILLLFGALGVFGQLQDAFNTIWEVQPREDAGVMHMVRQRLLSFSMILGISFLLIVSLVVSAVLALFADWVGRLLPGFDFLLTLINVAISFGILALLFAFMFKYLPDVEIPWNKVWIGAGMTALLFLVGQFLIGLYLGNTDVGSAYGAAGALVVLLIWVYYSTQILFLGAEFTQVYTNKFGEGVQPSPHAEPMTEEARAQQGLTRRNGSQNGQKAEEAQDERDAGEPAAKPGRATSRPVRYRTKKGATRTKERSPLASAVSILLAGFGIGSFIGRRDRKDDVGR
jgi:membrane protein